MLLGALLLAAAAVATFALTREDQVTVPAVLERDLAEARSVLERRGFEVAVATVSTCAPDNTVTEQQPPAGLEAEQGSRVTLTVSLGLSVQVPPMRGLPVETATRRLQDEDLLVKTRERASKEVAPGRAIGSRPPTGEAVDCQSPVTLLVSKGANLVELPSVVGLQEASAQGELERLGFIVDVDLQDADQPAGEVIAQSPVPGSELRRGATVVITVSTGAGAVIAPDVVGQPEDAARRTLQSRGLRVDVITQETDDASSDGRVLDQAPAAGARLRAGDLVTIFVGLFVEPEPEPEPEPTPEPVPPTPPPTTTTPPPEPVP
jgi:serine/threonine-protein kinase